MLINTKLIPITKWREFHQWPSEAGLRHLVFHAETNGFKKVVKRVGRRVLIDEAAFFDYVNELNQESNHATESK